MDTVTIKSYHIKAILAVLVYIETNVDQPLSLSKLASVAAISPCYFHRLFKAYLSMTPKEYIDRIRIASSTGRLCYSKIPIGDIAFAMGYEEPSSFTKAFVKYFKVSPRNYRKEKQKELLQFSNQPSIPAPEYVYRQEEQVVFLRKVGDYRKTVYQGIEECRVLFKGSERCYGIALDDPFTLSREECRFDLCVAKAPFLPQKGDWGKKVLTEGKYAVFTLFAPFCALEEAFTRCYKLWHRTEKFLFGGCFCEYVALFQIEKFTENTPLLAKYHVRVEE